jgi:hypothetical protein
VIPRRTVLFIKETVGLQMPDGGTHDGYWYASDIGGAIKGLKLDLFSGVGRRLDEGPERHQPFQPLCEQGRRVQGLPAAITGAALDAELRRLGAQRCSLYTVDDRSRPQRAREGSYASVRQCPGLVAAVVLASIAGHAAWAMTSPA